MKEGRITQFFLLSQTICLASPTLIRYVSLPIGTYSIRESIVSTKFQLFTGGAICSSGGEIDPVNMLSEALLLLQGPVPNSRVCGLTWP